MAAMNKVNKLKTYGERVADRVARSGKYVNGTREIIGFTDRIITSPSFWLNRSGADCRMMDEFFDRAVRKGEIFELGPYISSYYTFLKQEISKAATHFSSDGAYTRRAVVGFPVDHCFTSIQVLVRPGTFENPEHRATIIVNMRSCNVNDNFANDLRLAYHIGKEVIKLGFGAINNITTNDMVINIGSLHTFILK